MTDRSTTRELAGIARKIGALDQERWRLIDGYAAERGETSLLGLKPKARLLCGFFGSVLS